MNSSKYINVLIKFEQNPLIHFQDIQPKQNSDINQEPLLS